MENTKNFKLKKTKLVPWLVFILILLCLCIAFITLILLGKSNSNICPPPCQQCGPCGEKFDNVPLEDKFAKASSYEPLIYGGFADVSNVFGLQTQAAFAIIFDSPPVKKCTAELGNTIYIGDAKFCNLANPSLGDPETFKGSCQIFYTLIISKNPNKYFVNFSFVYGECSQTVTQKLGTITNLDYNPNNDIFTVNITTKEQTVFEKTVPSKKISIQLTDPPKTSQNLDPQNCAACTTCCSDPSKCNAQDCFS
jgi:hypothetical protein